MALMAGAALFFSAMGMCYRVALQEGLPTPAAPFARGAITLVIILPWLLRVGVAGMVTRRPWLMAWRCAAGLVAFQCSMLALLLLPLADAVAIGQARPIWAICLAAVLLNEKLRRDRVVAALVGFAGVIVIADPGGHLSWGLAAAVGAGISGALVLISVKKLAPTDPAMRVIAWYAVASVVFWAPLTAWLWVTPSLGALLLLVVGTLCSVVGDYMVSSAARRADAGLLAPMEYVQIPSGAFWGWLVFSELPGWGLPLGVALMLGASLYLARSARQT
jgi:drug/metabolite transporter (DMT)-like permease